MGSSMSYEDVSETMLACMKQMGAAQSGTVYEPADTNRGTATTKVPLFGNVVLTFDLDIENQVITYHIQQKPTAIPESLVWSQIAKIISDCRRPLP